MGLKAGYVEAKREIYYEGNIVEVFKGKDILSKLKKNKKEYLVDCQESCLFSVNILESSSYKEDFFIIDPMKNKIITRLEGYNDLWFNLNVGYVRKKTLGLVNTCFSILRDGGFSEDNLICFIKESDGFYYLVIDGERYGYLDKSNEDPEFKNMLTCVFRDVKSSVDVVVLPSKGKNLIFSSTLGVYKRKKDFFIACESKGIDLFTLGLDSVEDLVSVTVE